MLHKILGPAEAQLPWPSHGGNLHLLHVAFQRTDVLKARAKARMLVQAQWLAVTRNQARLSRLMLRPGSSKFLSIINGSVEKEFDVRRALQMLRLSSSAEWLQSQDSRAKTLRVVEFVHLARA